MNQTAPQSAPSSGGSQHTGAAHQNSGLDDVGRTSTHAPQESGHRTQQTTTEDQHRNDEFEENEATGTQQAATNGQNDQTDALTQDGHTQETHTQVAPTQDAPTQDAPTEGAPTQDMPVQDAPGESSSTEASGHDAVANAPGQGEHLGAPGQGTVAGASVAGPTHTVAAPGQTVAHGNGQSAGPIAVGSHAAATPGVGRGAAQPSKSPTANDDGEANARNHTELDPGERSEVNAGDQAVENPAAPADDGPTGPPDPPPSDTTEETTARTSETEPVLAAGPQDGHQERSGPPDPSPPRVVHAPKQDGFDGNSRGVGVVPASDQEVMGAGQGARESDFGGLIVGDPQVAGDVLTVQTADGPRQFQLEDGPIRSDKVAQTTLSTDGTPHRVRIDRSLRTDQLTRAWVHEISHALHELNGRMKVQPAGGPVADACLEAQANEHNLVARQWGEAKAVADRSGRAEDRAFEQQLRQELDALRGSVERQGRTVPAVEVRQVDGGVVGDREVRSYAGNIVARPAHPIRTGESVLAELRASIPEVAPHLQRTIAEAAAQQGIPVRNGRPVGWSLFGTAGFSVLGVTLDAAGFAQLETKLGMLLESGYRATLAITKLPSPATGLERFRYTVSLTGPNGVVEVHSAIDLNALEAALPTATAPVQAVVAQAASSASTLTGPGIVGRALQRIGGWAAFGNPGWFVVNSEARHVVLEPALWAAAGVESVTQVKHVTDVVHGLYQVMLADKTTIRLAVRVGPVARELWSETSLVMTEHGTNVDVVLSDQMSARDVAPVLARVLGEAVAEIGRGLDPAGPDSARVFGPATDPRAHAVQSVEDHGDRVELRQRGEQLKALRRYNLVQAALVRIEAAKLLTQMGLRGHQRSAELLKTLLDQTEREMVQALDTSRSLKDERARLRDYEVKALRGQGLTNLVIGTAAAVVTGDLATGIGIFVPALANALTGGVMERWLDGRKEVGRQPAFDADRVVRDARNPGLRSLLDEAVHGPQGPQKKLPRAISRWNYAARYAIPTLSSAAVIGALTLVGVPAWSSLAVIGFSALAKTVTEKLVDWKKFDYRLNRIDRSIDARLTNPLSVDNQVIHSFTELYTRLDRALVILTGQQEAGLPVRHGPTVPALNTTQRDMPPLSLHAGVQAVEGLSAAARRYFIGKPQDLTDPTELSRAIDADLEHLIGALGPVLPTGITGALGELVFMNREEAASDLQKIFDADAREATQAERAVGELRPWYDALEHRVRVLEAMAGLAPDLGVRAGERAGFPQAPDAPHGQRPYGQTSTLTYSIPVLAGAIGGVGGTVALSLVLGLPALSVVLTVAGAAGAIAGTPFGRRGFRRAELNRKDLVVEALAKQLADPRRVLEQRAVIRYLVTQLTVRAERFLARTEDAPSLVRPIVGTRADQLRIAINEAVRDLAGRPGPKENLYERLVAMEKVLDTVEALAHHGQHGTPESVALLEEELTERVDALDEFWQADGVPDGFPRPPLAPQRTAIQQALNPHGKPPKGPHYGREVADSRFVNDGRATAEGRLDQDAVLNAAPAETTARDFGELLKVGPRRVGDLVVVTTADTQEQHHFRVEVGPVRRGRMAATYLHAGTVEDPHVVHVAPGIANDQLGRVWVHEISHALHAFHGHGSRVQRVLGQVFGVVEESCVEAQFNEYRMLMRQYADALRAGESNAVKTLRQDIDALTKALERLGHTPPKAHRAEASLTTKERQRAFEARLSQLTPANLPNRPPGVPPRVVLLGGQPAAGKSTTQRLVHTALGPEEVASYDGDDNAAVHPRYDALRRDHGVEGHDMAGRALNNETKSELHWASLKHLREGETQYDVVASHPLARLEWAKGWVQGFRDHGYRVSVAYVATNHANSTLGIAERYQNSVDEEGGGRWLDPELHDQFYAELPDTAQTLESEALVDDIYVVDRDGHVLYENHRDENGNWEHEPAVKRAIVEERDRPPTPAAHDYLTRTADRLLNRDSSLPAVEPRVRELVERAVLRENERPDPEATNRDTAQRIDTRLNAEGRSGEVTRSPIQEALNPHGKPPKGPHYSRQVPGSRFVTNGRQASEVALDLDTVLDAAPATDVQDFGGLLDEAPHRYDDLVVVKPAGLEAEQYFRVEIGPVRRGRMAATYLQAGTVEDPHVVHLAPGIANDQLGRVWVHEISHALHAFHGHGSRVGRVLARITGAVENACMEAQFNEHRLLSRQYAEATAANDQAAMDEIRNDIEGLGRAIAKLGHTPPAVPWSDATSGPMDFAVAHQEAAARATELRALERAKRQAIRDAEQAAKDAGKAARQAAQERDAGRRHRIREKEREAAAKRDVADWHRRRMTAYRRAAREAERLRDKYAEVLRLPADQRAAHLGDLARRRAKVERELAPALPPRVALSDMLSVGNLPRLTELAEQLNNELSRLKVDYRFTVEDLQLRLNSDFGQLVTTDGIVLRVGAGRPIELRFALDIAQLQEVLNPGAKPSQLIHAETAQAGRRIGTAGTARFALNASQSLRDVTRLVFDQIPSIGALGELVNLRIDGGFNRSRSLGGSAATYAQDGATEDNRGEAVLFEGRGRWTVQARESEFGRWRPVVQDRTGAPMRGWVSHAYTVPATANQVSSGRAPAGPLPELLVSSIDGLQRLTDRVTNVFGGRLSSFGEHARDLREQIQEALTQDLPGRLPESTGRPIIRPLTANGKPVGHLEIRTVVQYVRTELVGAQSTAHWQERDRIGFRSAAWSQSFGTGVSGKGAVEVGASGVTDLAGTDSAYVAEASMGRDARRSESQGGGGSALHIGVHRFVGPTQGYQLVLTHEVSLVLDGQLHGSVRSDSEALVRMRVDDAYRHGLKVSSDAIVRDASGRPRLDPNGNPYLRGDVLPETIAGRRMELPEWAEPGVGSGPALVQRVTGAEGAVSNVIRHLAERDFLPPMTPDGRIDLDRLTTDPIERQAQLANLEELTAQLAPNRLEVGYDGAVRDGLLVDLIRTRTAAPTETATLRIRLIQDPAGVTVVGTTADEAMVALNIGSESAGRSVGRSKGVPLGAKPFGLNDSDQADGQGGSLGVSLGRNAFGRGMGSLTGGTVNQVTLLESAAPLAVFELGHRFVVSEVQQDAELIIHDAPGTARVLIDSDLLPMATPIEEVATPQLTPAVLQRILVLAVQNPDLLTHLPAELLNDPLTRELVQNFLDQRNLIAHPEWFGTTYRSGAITSPGSIAGRHQLGIRGTVGNVRLVSVTDGVGADISLGLSNQGASVAWSTATSGTVSDSVSVESNGGGLNGGGNRSHSAGRTQQLITGIERAAIDIGRHYVFVADTQVTLNDDTAAAHAVYDAGQGQLLFQIGETEALRFYLNGELKLPLAQVADAVERYLNGSLPLDARTAAGLIRLYRQGLSKSPAPPALAVHHSEARIIAALTATDPDLGKYGDRLAAVLPEALKLSTATTPVPPQYRNGLGGSVIESVGFQNAPDQTSGSPVLEAVRAVAENIGVRIDADAVLTSALFADLAGKRWWSRIDDMLGGRGFVRTYAIEHGQHAGSHVTVRVTAVLSEEATDLGVNPGLLSSNQRYLFDDRSTTTTDGRSLSGGLNGSLDSGADGSTSTDRAQSNTRALAETHSRMERVSEFSGLTRVGRGIKLKIEVTHDQSPAPTNGRLRSRLQPTEERPGLTVSDEFELHGTLVQHLPAGLAKTKLGPIAPAPASLPETVWVETVGSQDSAQLIDAVVGGLTDVSRFGRSGVELHRTEIEAQLTPGVLNAAFTRMAGDEGVRVLRLSVPGQSSEAVDVVIRAVPLQIQEVSEVSPDGEIGIVDRVARTVGTSSSVGRLVSPPTGAAHAVGETGFRGGFTGGDQRSDQVTDTRGIRRERHRLESGDLVVVRVGVRYEIALVPVRVLGFDPTRPDRPGVPINLPAVPGEVYLTGHHHEIGVNP